MFSPDNLLRIILCWYFHKRFTNSFISSLRLESHFSRVLDQENVSSDRKRGAVTLTCALLLAHTTQCGHEPQQTEHNKSSVQN
jgi:hypothetical protein